MVGPDSLRLLRCRKKPHKTRDSKQDPHGNHWIDSVFFPRAKAGTQHDHHSVDRVSSLASAMLNNVKSATNPSSRIILPQQVGNMMMSSKSEVVIDLSRYIVSGQALPRWHHLFKHQLSMMVLSTRPTRRQVGRSQPVTDRELLLLPSFAPVFYLMQTRGTWFGARIHQT